LAREQGFPPYVVFNDRTLHAMATLRPHTLDDFDRVPGVGDFKKAKYGEVFLEEINR
jgi:ATP-dependent DNA helicase recQ